MIPSRRRRRAEVRNFSRLLLCDTRLRCDSDGANADQGTGCQRLLHLGRRQRRGALRHGDRRQAATSAMTAGRARTSSKAPSSRARTSSARFDPGAQPRAVRPLSRSDRPARQRRPAAESEDARAFRSRHVEGDLQPLDVAVSGRHLARSARGRQPVARDPRRRLRRAHGRDGRRSAGAAAGDLRGPVRARAAGTAGGAGLRPGQRSGRRRSRRSRALRRRRSESPTTCRWRERACAARAHRDLDLRERRCCESEASVSI